MNRPLTNQERNWLIRGLKTLETGEYFGGDNWIDTETNKRKSLDQPIDPLFHLQEVESLYVVGQCNCGERNCHTIQFQNYEKGKSAAIVCYHTEDKRMLIIHINESTGKLAELEII
jgi:hypothetical protein